MGSSTPTHNYSMDSDYSASRLPPSSSALIALSTLVPPSPCLSASLSITSGDIPILLDGLEFSANHRYSAASDFSDWRISARASLHESDLPQSSSCVSTGTFGPIYRRRPLAYREFESHAEGHEPYTASAVTWPQTTLESQGPPERVSYLECAYTAIQPTSKTDMESTTVKCASGGEIRSDVVDSETPIRKERLSLREGLHAQLASSTAQHDDPYDMASNRPTSATATKVKFKPVAYFAPAGDKGRSTFSLDNIRTVISIDQEGFRSVNPSFKFVGHSKRTFDDKRQRAETMAQFVPVNQQTFHFHYAPLDGQPVLRRISVNDDETRDYISREATLGLKSNGIYIVHGTELAIQTMHDENRGHGAMELHWEFVYKVDDRKVGPSKKVIDGEKNLTPLSLSCSPALLNSCQGKRVNLLHIVKKSITAKLTAEKLEASEYILARPPLHNKTNSASGRHRRALSYGRQPELSTCNTKPPAQRGVLQENRSDFDGRDLSRGARRRRASSAGEWNSFDSQPRTKVEADIITMCPPIQKHIVSPARLAQMLETKSVKKNTLPAIPQIDFYPLAPNPRHYRSRARNGMTERVPRDITSTVVSSLQRPSSS